MNSEQRRQNRICVLREVYIKSGMNERAVIRKAESMGVARRTSMDYLKVVKSQVRSKLNV